MKQKGITLIALVITIVILLVLAGITISTLAGENGLLTRATQVKQAQIESEMKEQLALALQDLQIEKLGNATLDDITQEWIDSKIQNYNCTIKEDASISGKRVIMEKNGVICKFLIDENLNSTVIEESESGAQLEYETISRDGENVNILITITDTENGLQQVEFPDGTILYCNGEEQLAKDYEVQLGVEYIVKITSKNGQVKEETILINDYYHTITKNLGEGISIDNAAIKAAYNKPYKATITAGTEYIMESITVTMGGEVVTVDITTGVINIEKVTGDIKITATARKLEIEITTPIIGTTTTATSSVADNSQARGTTLYINFSATLEGTECTVTPTLPYELITNGKYKFIATGTYNGATITKDIEIVVKKYEEATGVVKYDAGDWTQEEIEVLQSSKLYDLNETHIYDNTFKLKNDSGWAFTFGGFTYKGDTANENKEGVITSRNQSVSPESGRGTPKYDGWQILESVQENGKTYVTKLIHAGSPENFSYYGGMNHSTKNEYRAVYLLGGSSSYTTLSDGTKINQRNWDMYIDEEQKDLIEEVHCMTYDEYRYASELVRTTGSYYFLAKARGYSVLYFINSNGTALNNGETYSSDRFHCFGIRPVVTMVDGVYIASGDGTESSPYVLGKE